MFAGEAELLAALRMGEEAAFVTAVERYQTKMLRLARIWVSDETVAEEVTQEAWIGVLRGLANFEGRASLQTWIFTILANCARTRAQRERRTIPFSEFYGEEAEEELTVAPERFHSSTGRFPGHWRAFPDDWHALPEERFLARETLDVTQAAIEKLPANQRTVILMRDVDGLTAEEVCNILQISESNQRVLLHRARAAVQKTLELYFREG